MVPERSRPAVIEEGRMPQYRRREAEGDASSWSWRGQRRWLSTGQGCAASSLSPDGGAGDEGGAGAGAEWKEEEADTPEDISEEDPGVT
eukprot:CAMPEP_0194286108 /NCGR_PEP_ID=MMETSP0169-20130528/31846_1 /TAXON_ID=218684 /ORGANISM="Corethron pennatum, Strain L29A3" /LENGTH=88 /DNA_ID=CAMNT_0039032433 /DNA_START=448 /DNA_END=718 /DNA_ORIENTATION=+